MRPESYRTVIDPSWCDDPAHRMRWAKTLSFVSTAGIGSPVTPSGLDIGDRTPMTGMLESHFGCRFETTSVDLDTDPLDGCFSVVTAFEVLEHLYNPLHLMLEIRKVLHPADSSRLFISTPAWKPGILQSPDHFHEMSRRSLESLISRSGMTVMRRGEFRIRPLLFCLKGFRPLLRFFFEKIMIYELAVR